MLKDNKKMIATLAILVGLFFFVRWMKADKNIRNFDTELFSLDTAQVAEFSLFPKAENQEEIKFTKTNGTWTVSKGNISSLLANNQATSMLGTLLTVKPKRLAARTKDKWEKYEVSDSLGTRLLVKNKAGEPLVDLVIGKFSYKQAPAQPGYGGQNNISGLTYIRNFEEVETYATEGFLAMTFNRAFDSFRDKQLITCQPENVRTVAFKSPQGNFALNKGSNDWQSDDLKADSTKVAQYLNQLKNLNGSKVNDRFTVAGESEYTCSISGDNMEAISVKAYPNKGKFMLQSSMNPNTIFESDSSGLFFKLFKTESDFLKEE